MRSTLADCGQVHQGYTLSLLCSPRLGRKSSPHSMRLLITMYQDTNTLDSCKVITDWTTYHMQVQDPWRLKSRLRRIGSNVIYSHCLCKLSCRCNYNLVHPKKLALISLQCNNAFPTNCFHHKNQGYLQFRVDAI